MPGENKVFHGSILIVREHFKIFAGRPAALPFSRYAALMPLCRSAALPRHNEFVLITF